MHDTGTGPSRALRSMCFMHDGHVPIPARPGDLIRSATAGMFTFAESRHACAIRPHAHRGWTLTVLLGGAFEERYAGRRAAQACRRFAVLLGRPGEVHENRIAPQGAHNLLVELDDDRHARIEGLALGEDAVAGAALEIVARRLHRELGARDEARALALEGLGLELVAALARSQGRASERGVVDRARAMLADRFRERGLRVADVAAALDIHPVALARAFRATTGSSPSEFVRRLRLDWAMSEVARSARPLASIAAEAGFADQSHMTRALRAAFGVTPARVRRGCRARMQG
jgi:AraC family transcriptional regulator